MTIARGSRVAALLGVLLGAVACGPSGGDNDDSDDSDGATIDAAPPPPDADPGAPDAGPDEPDAASPPADADVPAADAAPMFDAMPMCMGPGDCDDLDPCTEDQCNGGTCANPPVAVADMNECTLDACVPGTGEITHTPTDALCMGGEICGDMGCEPAPAVVVSEIRPVLVPFVELTSTSAIDADVAGLILRNAAGQTAVIRHVDDPDGTLGLPVIVPAMGAAFGRPTPPPGESAGIAQFTYGEPGTDFAFDGGGDFVELRTVGGTQLDLVDFRLFYDVAGGTPPADAFPGHASKSFQLDPAHLTVAGNDDGDHWCLTFRGNHTAGNVNPSCHELVVNEVLYDFDHPSLSAADDGRTFVEIAGPGGADLSGVRIVGIDGDGVGVQEPSTTLPAGTRMPLDGIFVLADGITGMTTTTHVPNADLVAPCDPTNGNSNGDAIQILAPDMTVLDQVGYGAAGATVSEGTPVADVDPDETALSIARDLASTDTDDNAADFHLDPTPSPGLPNQPVVPTIVSVDPDDYPFVVGGAVQLVVRDVGDFADMNDVATADNDVNATFLGFGTGDTSATGDGCNFVQIADEGRGEATLVCVAPSGMAAARGDIVVTNPAALGGGVATRVDGWTYTTDNNDPAVADPAELDFCNLQFPTSFDAVTGTLTPLVFGQFFEAGVTDVTSGAVPGVLAELGYGPTASDPRTQNTWTWFPAAFNVEVGNNDEYQVQFVAPAAGSYSTVYRFSRDGGVVWTYCDADGAGENPGLDFSPAQLGTMTVMAP